MATGRFRPSKANPLTSGATAETVRLYRRLIDMGKRSGYLLGTNEMLAGDVGTYPSPTTYDTQGALQANTGRGASIVGFEYHDSAWSTRYGSTGTTYIRAQIIAAAAAGKVIELHHHMGNPATGALPGVGTAWPPSGAGSAYDLTGTPLTTIKSGGAQFSAWTAYLDRLAAFIASLTDAQGKLIPIIWRPFHEVNGGWFWWSTNQADLKTVWQQMVTYLRDTKGLTNVLFCFNWSSDTASLSGWYPGDAYVDVLSLDHYVNSSGPNIWTGGTLAAAYSAMLAVNSSKPCILAEFGYQQQSTNNSVWAETARFLGTTYSRFAAAMLWRSPWGPATTDSAGTKADQAAMVADPRSLTL